MVGDFVWHLGLDGPCGTVREGGASVVWVGCAVEGASKRSQLNGRLKGRMMCKPAIGLHGGEESVHGCVEQCPPLVCLDAILSCLECRTFPPSCFRM